MRVSLLCSVASVFLASAAFAQGEGEFFGSETPGFARDDKAINADARQIAARLENPELIYCLDGEEIGKDFDQVEARTPIKGAHEKLALRLFNKK